MQESTADLKHSRMRGDRRDAEWVHPNKVYKVYKKRPSVKKCDC